MFVLGEEIVQHPAVKIQLFIFKKYINTRKENLVFFVIQLQ